MTADTDQSSPKKREPRMFVVLVLMMLSMIACRYILPSVRVGNLPVPKRGDMVLQDQDLPAEPAGWSKARFLPAADPLAVANVESWWVHSWDCVKDGRHCLVTLDQALWVAWHELSACYVANGWVQGDRHVYEVPDKNGETWHIVTVEYEKSGTGRGLLIFSEFGSNGTLMEALYMGQPFESYDLQQGRIIAGQSSVGPADRWRSRKFYQVYRIIG